MEYIGTVWPENLGTACVKYNYSFLNRALHEIHAHLPPFFLVSHLILTLKEKRRFNLD